MKLEWKYDDERGVDEAVTDHGVFRITEHLNGTFSLSHSDRELGCPKFAYRRLEQAKYAARKRYAEILAREVTR